MEYDVVLLEDNTLMLCTAGDVIAHSDPNHAKPGGDPSDWRHFRLMCAALNHAATLRNYIAAELKQS